MAREVTSIEIADALGWTHKRTLSTIKQCFHIAEKEQKENIKWTRSKYKKRFVEVAILDQEAIQKLARWYDYKSEQLSRASINLRNKKGK